MNGATGAAAVVVAPLPARLAYPLWAPRYDNENGITRLDEIAVARLSPNVYTSLLDAGTGTGRRLSLGTSRAVGIDLVFEMLVAGRRPPNLLNADFTSLPFRTAAFDLIWCRLAVGHLPSLRPAYSEFARVLSRGGTLIVTDFHPEAVRCGFRRDFRDALGARHEVEHHVHELLDHEAAARAAGLQIEREESFSIGPEIRGFFEEAGERDRYQRQQGLPVLLGVRFRLTRRV